MFSALMLLLFKFRNQKRNTRKLNLFVVTEKEQVKYLEKIILT